jgi:hypothetical protein
MKNFLEGVFDVVFSLPTFLIGLIVGFALLIMGVAGAEQEEKELRTKQTAYCYSLGQVLVTSDAGRHCVAPENLTVIK